MYDKKIYCIINEADIKSTHCAMPFVYYIICRTSSLSQTDLNLIYENFNINGVSTYLEGFVMSAQICRGECVLNLNFRAKTKYLAYHSKMSYICIHHYF